jgi:hypothetical protein
MWPHRPGLGGRNVKETGGETSKLSGASSYDEIFSMVKAHVESVLGLHRAGLTLGLASLPPGIGAYHVVGSNMIVLNKEPLEKVRGAEPPEILASFIYMLLLHEYLHSLGLMDEEQVKKTSEEVASRALGAGHPASVLIRTPFTELFPYLGSLSYADRAPGEVEIIRDFDSKSYPFIS